MYPSLAKDFGWTTSQVCKSNVNFIYICRNLRNNWNHLHTFSTKNRKFCKYTDCTKLFAEYVAFNLSVTH